MFIMANALGEMFKKNDEFVLNILRDSTKEINKLVENFFYNIKMYEKTGDQAYLFSDIKEAREMKQKENQTTAVSALTTKRMRSKKGALTDITENNWELPNIKIKQEKLSVVSTTSEESKVSSSCEENIVLKQEEEEMPAPKKLPPRKRKILTEPTPANAPKRSTRTRKKTEKMEEFIRESNSDVVIQNATLITVDITNEPDKTCLNNIENELENCRTVRCTRSKMRQKINEEDSTKVDKNTEPMKSVRSTRTKVKKQKMIDSEEEKSVEQTEKKSVPLEEQTKNEDAKNEDADANKTTQTEYEDAVSTLETENIGSSTLTINKTELEQPKSGLDNNQVLADGTFTIDTLNSTYVLEKPNNMNNNTVVLNKDNQNTNSPVVQKKTKEIFSPFEKSSTKKKIEAFEKLGSRIETPIKSKQFNTENQTQLSKNKGYTPVPSRFYSTVKNNKKYSKCDTPTSSNNVSLISTKSQSALKASQAEFREREIKRQEKEREALKKREALLQALSETKRKKREEKMLKAQQQRELLEQNNLKKVETQKMKQEKFEQLMAEKEERARQQREKSEKKRLLVKKKADELKEKSKEKIHEMNNLEIMKSAQKEQHTYRYNGIPKYMVTPAPLLPTEDCYDSDECQYPNKKSTKPYWSTDREIAKTQLAIQAVGEKIINTFFFRQIHTPNLQEIFETIDPKKLKRTSSAIWRKPPRYTLFSETSHVIFSEEEEDGF